MGIEADGARGLCLKAPASHEPLVPDFTNTLVPVMGAAAFGQRLSPDWVHRPEVAANVMGIPVGERLTVEHVARLLSSPAGGLKGRPPRADVRVLITMVDDPAREELARLCARRLLDEERIKAVLLADLVGERGVRQVLGRVGGVILAAGGSRRMGRPKLLQTWKGEPLLRYAVGAALDAGLAPVVVVVGDEAESLRPVIADLPVKVVVNDGWDAGQSSSVRAGLRVVRAQVEAAVFLLGDMPLVNSELVGALVRKHAETLASIVAPTAGGRRGNPVVFDRSTFDALSRIEGDRGGRAVFGQFEIEAVECEPDAFFDLDTPDDLDWLEGQV